MPIDNPKYYQRVIDYTEIIQQEIEKINSDHTLWFYTHIFWPAIIPFLICLSFIFQNKFYQAFKFYSGSEFLLASAIIILSVLYHRKIHSNERSKESNATNIACIVFCLFLIIMYTSNLSHDNTTIQCILQIILYIIALVGSKVLMKSLKKNMIEKHHKKLHHIYDLLTKMNVRSG